MIPSQDFPEMRSRLFTVNNLYSILCPKLPAVNTHRNSPLLACQPSSTCCWGPLSRLCQGRNSRCSIHTSSSPNCVRRHQHCMLWRDVWKGGGGSLYKSQPFLQEGELQKFIKSHIIKLLKEMTKLFFISLFTYYTHKISPFIPVLELKIVSPK